jgi:pimeloyl-ACP methyl ester carboxylesterase
VTETGYFTASYVSPVDDTEQPFALWVPRTYTPRRKYPLIVALHGSDADHRMIPENCFRMPAQGFNEEVILLSPFGRGDVNYRWMGEADLWDAMNWVKKRYRVDARRQYLTGLSMGGYAAWRLACAYPEQWAAVAPICGGGEVAALGALKNIPVWCVHGERDEVVPVERSRELVAELQRLKLRPRYSELKGWGHNVWDWLYDPRRKYDTLVHWLLKCRKRSAAPARREPARTGGFMDLFNGRIVISHPGQTPIPREGELLRAEAGRLAAFSMGDYAMRTGRLIVKRDGDLTPTDLRGANHLMLGRTDNHVVLAKAGRKLRARHAKGVLTVNGETFLGKSLVAATCQPSPWNPKKLLGIITYQQFQQMRGMVERCCDPERNLPAINLYDTQQQRFIKGEAG